MTPPSGSGRCRRCTDSPSRSRRPTWQSPGSRAGPGSRSETRSACHGSRCTPSTESETPVFEHIAKSPIAAVVRSALEEARRRGDRRLSTEHLLLALLYDPAAAPARALGVDLETARAALDALDRAALA